MLVPNLYECPKCHSLEFREETIVMYSKDSKGKRSKPYRIIKRYTCCACHNVIDEVNKDV